MHERLPALLVALLALPGLLGRSTTVSVHAHEGGEDVHHHARAAVRCYLAHGHDHGDRHERGHRHGRGHRHDRGHHHPHGTAPDEPRDAGQPDGTDHPYDGDQHGHIADRTTPAIRRSLLVDDAGPRLLTPTLTPALNLGGLLPRTLAFEPPPREPGGHHGGRTPRVAARLVQGIGLLI